MPCKKHGSTNLSTYISSSTGKIKIYCKTCRIERARKYSQRLKLANGTHTKKEWLNKLAEHDHCPKCKSKWGEIPLRPDKRYKYVWTKDHIIPLLKGGSNSIDNLQPLCYRCNFGKR